MKIAESIDELVGETPLIRLSGLMHEYGIRIPLYGKQESKNPCGSAKDRVALAILDDAEKRGILKEGTVIIEPTSGNTGIGLAAYGARRGYRILLTMPESMSAERRRLLAAYGAELVLTPAESGMAGAIEEAKRLASELGNAFIPSQFENPANPRAHYMTTGPEILRDSEGVLSCFVAAVGTGGTLSGTGRYLKEHIPGIRIIAVEPAESPLLSGGVAAPHRLQGIGANFIPENLDRGVYDKVIPICYEEACEAARLLARRDGLLVGISSGAALAAAVRVARELPEGSAPIAVLLPDTGERYLSSGLFD